MKRLRSAVADPLARPPTTACRAALQELAHGELVGEALHGSLLAEIDARLAAAGAEPASIRLSDLRARREGLPKGWAERGNLILAGAGAGETQLTTGFMTPPACNGLIVLGASARLHAVHLSDEGAVVLVGDAAQLPAANVAAHGPSLIAIGAKTTATFDAQLDARNGGAIVVGEDGMWGNGVRIMTDDMHTIRDRKSGRRLNHRGGRIVIGPHVWLSEQVAVLGGRRIGADTVVGFGALVTRDLPGASVCVGRPARPVRRGVTWSREDAP